MLQLYPSAQSTGSPPWSTSSWLTRLNGRGPQKPPPAPGGGGGGGRPPGTDPTYQRLDRALGDLLPAAPAVRGGGARLHREHPVEQHHAAIGPAGQVAVRRWLDADD